MRKRRRKKRFNVLFFILSLIMLISFTLNAYLILKFNVLPIKYLIIFVVLFFIIPLMLSYLTIFKRLRSAWRVLAVIYDIGYIIIMVLIFFYLSQTFNFLNNFTNDYDYETKNYYVLVNKNAEYKKIADLNDKTIGFSKNLDSSSKNALSSLKKEVEIVEQEYAGLSEMLTNLNDGQIDSILIIDAFYDMLVESEDEIVSSTKILYKFAIKEKIAKIQKDVDVKKETFNIYISGIDTFGNVTDKARSDVNIIMSVNPKTNQILMINIPRDYYVDLNGFNQKDKLTHAGMYGVNTSVKTIEDLLDIDINYYVKMNFNALVKVVDALGGVEVYSSHDFYSTEVSHHFKEGYNYVDGELALDFARTRKAFLDGDRVRGENQQALIQAVINKACSAEILLKYDDILNSLEGSFTTNMSTESMMDLVNMQLDEMPKWKMQSIGLNGTDSHNFTYTYPQQELYVMIPNDDTIANAKKILDMLKQNETLNKKNIELIMNP